MKIRKMSGGVNLAARLLVLKTKKIWFFKIFDEFSFFGRIYILHIFKIKNDEKDHFIQKLIAMRKSDSLFLYTNIYTCYKSMKIIKRLYGKVFVWESNVE